MPTKDTKPSALKSASLPTSFMCVAFVSVRPWVFVLETVVKDESHRKEETLSSQFPDPSRQSSANPPKRAQKKRFPGSQVLVSTGLTRLAVTHLGNH
jgi:hypothetical protein